jgi:hypothetical protein
VEIRRIEASDEARWRELFAQYTRFYEREPDEAITHHVWSRIMDPAAPVYAIVAEHDTAGVIGIANYAAQRLSSLRAADETHALTRGARQGRSALASATGNLASMKSASRVAPGGSTLLNTTTT